MRQQCQQMVTVALILIVGLSPKVFSGANNDKKFTIVCRDKNDNKAWLGVQIKDLTRKLRQELDTKARYGAVIDEIVDNSPADEAGLEPGDVIVKVDDQNIRSVKDLTDYLSEMSAEDEIDVQVMRGNERQDITVILGSRSDNTVWSGTLPNIQFKGFSPGAHLGLEVREMDSDLAEYFKVSEDEGVLVVRVDQDGPAQQAGIKSGDVLTSIGGEEITDAESILDILSEYEADSDVEFEFVRQGRRQTARVHLKDKPFSFKSFSIPNFSVPEVPNLDGLGKGRGGRDFRLREEIGNRSRIHQRELEELRNELKDLREELKKLKNEFKQ